MGEIRAHCAVISKELNGVFLKTYVAGRAAVATRGAIRARNDLRTVQAMTRQHRKKQKAGAPRAREVRSAHAHSKFKEATHVSSRGHDRNRARLKSAPRLHFWSDFE
jgi:hypothetical protein